MSETSNPDELAFLDQLAAATKELTATTNQRAALGYAAGYYSAPGRWGTREDVPDWVKQGWEYAFTPWMHGEGRTCRHNPNVLCPQPVWACAWKPGLVVCAECLHLFDVATVAEDRTCDGCGRVCVVVPKTVTRYSASASTPISWRSGSGYAATAARRNSDEQQK
jgi:hypothetical protein